MTWVRIDDHFDEHPKFARAGPLAMALWLAGLAYCNRNLTDGFIPWSVAMKLVSWQYLDDPPDDGRPYLVSIALTCGMGGEDVASQNVASRLLKAGLWEEVDGGYHVHDYADYQPSREDVLRDRQKNAERQAKFRHNAVTNSVTTGHANRSSNAVRNTVSNDPPGPGPGPGIQTSLTNVRDAASDDAALLISYTENGRQRKRAPTREAMMQPASTTLAIVPKSPRPKNVQQLMWDAALEAGLPEPQTSSERGKWNKGIKELLDAGETPATLGSLVTAYEDHYEGRIDCTLTAIAGNLSQIKAGRRDQRAAVSDARYLNDDEWRAKRLADAAWERTHVAESR